jgi:hypothetical protein
MYTYKIQDYEVLKRFLYISKSHDNCTTLSSNPWLYLKKITGTPYSTEF